MSKFYNDCGCIINSSAFENNSKYIRCEVFIPKVKFKLSTVMWIFNTHLTMFESGNMKRRIVNNVNFIVSYLQDQVTLTAARTWCPGTQRPTSLAITCPPHSSTFVVHGRRRIWKVCRYKHTHTHTHTQKKKTYIHTTRAHTRARAQTKCGN